MPPPLECPPPWNACLNGARHFLGCFMHRTQGGVARGPVAVARAVAVARGAVARGTVAVARGAASCRPRSRRHRRGGGGGEENMVAARVAARVAMRPQAADAQWPSLVASGVRTDAVEPPLAGRARRPSAI